MERRRRGLKELLLEMPDVGDEEDFERHDDLGRPLAEEIAHLEDPK